VTGSANPARGLPVPAIRRTALLLPVIFLLIYVLPLGIRPLSSPDEVRYAEISREMIASGDWVSPRLAGLRYFEKPVMGYWINAAALEILGENAFAVRLPSAVAAGLTALLVLIFTARYANGRSGYLSAGIFLSTLLVLGVGTFALLDMFLTFFLTGALASFYAASSESSAGARRRELLLCGAFCAGAFLTKGFLALALPVIVGGAYLILRRSWRGLARLSWLPIAVCAVLVAPWAILIALREPDFWRYFFWIEHVQRFLGDNAQHARPFWFFLAYGPIVALPWIVLLPAALIGLRRNTARDGFATYVILWAVLPFLFFSASNGKLLTYILPCLAPLSILLGVGLERYMVSAGSMRAYKIGTALLGALVMLAVLTLGAAQRGVFGKPLYAATEGLREFTTFAFLVLAFGATVVGLLARNANLKLGAVAAAGVGIFMPPHLAMLPQSLIDKMAPAGFLAQAVGDSSGAVLVSDETLAGAVSWVFRRDDVYILHLGEFRYGLEYPESRQRALDGAGLAELAAANSGRTIIVIRDSTAADLPAALVQSAARSERGNVLILRL
jgi:4-amino-4-deoxy-L-arabinose transferase